MGVFGAQGRLFDWCSEEGKRLAKASGLDDQDVVPLGVWLDVNPASLGVSADAMCRFLDEDDLPDLRDLDDLRAARRRHLERSRM